MKALNEVTIITETPFILHTSPFATHNVNIYVLSKNIKNWGEKVNSLEGFLVLEKRFHFFLQLFLCIGRSKQ